MPRSSHDRAVEDLWWAQNAIECAIICLRCSGEKQTVAEIQEWFSEGVEEQKGTSRTLRSLYEWFREDAKKWRISAESRL